MVVYKNWLLPNSAIAVAKIIIGVPSTQKVIKFGDVSLFMEKRNKANG